MERLSHSHPLPALGRVTRKGILLFFVFAGLIYFLKGLLQQKTSSESPSIRLPAQATGEEAGFHPNVTPWGAPIVWGDSPESQIRRQKFTNRAVTTGLAVFVVGTYAQYLHKFIISAEEYFLPEHFVTYYILTDNLRGIPTITLGSGREIKPFYIAERPDWVYLSKTRMSLLSSVIKELIQDEVDYIFSMDVDQVFVNPVGSEILGSLVATLHPEYYNQPLDTYPYERTEDSKAYVDGSEGDYYYTSEIYGGSCPEVYKLALTCSQFIIQDMEISFHAFLFEESYLNRYLIQNRPTRLLSPEYNWLAAQKTSEEIQVKRILSLQR
ncbi:globoside alpha-1,3-N-acetylgalactosaminyltransferase 1-like [Polyodon spathula]|uniref:globoside alpha-1,3-N-acetylgalactosaminyltransferase 1-like n=1 Tax=Polyodon spathula TaxID=7913 RepID=UPI001B7E0059|nr:globoside alpha-1,3-N-acetylgalactosaminyltransferase 1-like [Polyodon spathula]